MTETSPARPAGAPEVPVLADAVTRRAIAPRNGLPVVPFYAWRARVYPQAVANLAAAEAEHGAPAPVCVECDGPLTGKTWPNNGLCDTCRAAAR